MSIEGGQGLRPEFHESEAPIDIFEVYRDVEVEIFGRTGTLGDLGDPDTGLCPVDWRNMPAEKVNRFAANALNASGAAVLPEHETYFHEIIESQGREYKLNTASNDIAAKLREDIVARAKLTQEDLPAQVSSGEEMTSRIEKTKEAPSDINSPVLPREKAAAEAAVQAEAQPLNQSIVEHDEIVDVIETVSEVGVQLPKDQSRIELPPETRQYLQEATIRAGTIDGALHVESVQAVIEHESTGAVGASESFVSKDIPHERVERVADDHSETKIEQDDTVLHEIRQALEATFDLSDRETVSDAIEVQEPIVNEALAYVEFDTMPDHTSLEYSEEMHDEAVEHVMLLLKQALGDQVDEGQQDEPLESSYEEPAARVEIISIDAPDLVLGNVKRAIMAFETEATPEESEQIGMLYAEMTQITEFLSQLQVQEASEALAGFAQQSVEMMEAIEHAPLNAITEEQLIARLEIVCERVLTMLDAPHDKEYVQAMVQQLVTLIEDREAWDKSKALTTEELAVMGTREYKLAFRHQQSDDSNTAVGDRFKQIGATALGIFRDAVSHGALVLV